MEFLIVGEQSFPLGPPIYNYNYNMLGVPAGQGYCSRKLTVTLQVTQELVDKLNLAGIPTLLKVGQFIPVFDLVVGFEDTSGPGPYQGCFRVAEKGSFVRDLFGFYAIGDEDEFDTLTGPNFQLQIFKIRQLEGQPTFLIPVEKSYLSGWRGQRFNVTTNLPNDWIRDWASGNWTIVLCIKVLATRKVKTDLSIKDLLEVNRRMLNNEVFTDTMVIASNGAAIKFHRSILGTHSPVFERMFQTQMEEARSGVLELPDMTEESVRALREYLYLWEWETPRRNSLVCFELFEAGHKYDIPTLEKRTGNFLLRMGVAWYSVEVALRLFLMVKDIRQGNYFYLKRKAIEILKLKRAELEKSAVFVQLSEENPAAARHLTECFGTTYLYTIPRYLIEFTSKI